MKYRQCEFQSGTAHTTAWIPEWAAAHGNFVQLKDSDNPEKFWQIIAVGAYGLEEESVKSNSRNYREFQGSTKGGGID